MRTSSQASVFLRTLLLGGDFSFYDKNKTTLMGQHTSVWVVTSSRKA